MSKRSLVEWLKVLESLHPSEMDLGLERVSSVADRLGLLEPQCPVVTIAGTNGKGSTAAALEVLLHGAGRRVGIFTSPHLQRFNERVKIAGREATDEQLIAAFEVIDDARERVTLTYFEFSTLAALWLFRELAAEVIILEVGLGGRLDATNIVDSSVAIVTTIAFDHQQWLGETIEEIALEKAGILRPGKPVIIADPQPPRAILDRAEAIGARPVLRFGHDFDLVDQPGVEAAFKLTDSQGAVVRLPAPTRTDLLPQNLCAAVQAACLLKSLPTAQEIRTLLSDLVVTGRCQTLQVAGLNWILDVAHNPASAIVLRDYLAANDCSGRTVAIFSAMADKDIRGIVTPLQDYVDAWFLADQPDNPRAAAAGDIASLLRSLGESMISVSKNLRQAIRRARNMASDRDRLVIFGSFFTVAAALTLMEKDRRNRPAGAAT